MSFSAFQDISVSDMNQNLINIEFPPIVPLQRRIAEKKRRGEKVTNLTQAVIDIMPEINVDYINSIISMPDTHLYSPDEGIMELRQSLAGFFNETWGGKTEYSDIVLTPGANNAYFSLVVTLLNKDSRMLLPVPYYFNHKMAGEMLGVDIAVCGDKAQTIAENIRDNDIVTIVSPSNPSGRIYSADEIGVIINACRQNDAYLIIDETYALIRYDKPFSAITMMNSYDKLFVIGSFSKSVPMAGWRLGYAVMNESYMEQFVKVQGTNVICAPVISQKILGNILPNLKNNVHNINSMLIKRRNALLKGLAHEGDKPKGACFLFLNINCDDRKFADELLEKHNIGVIPGAFFGMEKFIRISYGSCSENVLFEAGETIRKLV